MDHPLNIVFYAPLKSPSHPVPSGDRLMARLLILCLETAGHQVTVISDLRAYLGDAGDAVGWAHLQTAAGQERDRIRAQWADQGRPDIWFCYHPYYKSPDLIGPVLAAEFGIAYVTCEASYSDRRNIGIWAEMQVHALAAIRSAALNICMTERDRRGLAKAAPQAHLARLSPFIVTDGFDAAPIPQPGHMVCVAMMRPGDKFASYVRLAATVALLPADLDWHLSFAGDGPMQSDVHALFSGLPEGRISWLGKLDHRGVAALLATGALYVWPGCGEAYGLAYLEAQAAGLPVVAQDIAGVPEVVLHGQTGLLTPPGDDAAAATAMAQVLTDTGLQRKLGQAARLRARTHHGMAGTSTRLSQMLTDVVGGRR